MSRLLNSLRQMVDGAELTLSEEFMADIRWWSTFLPGYNGVSMMFLDSWSAPDKVVASDSCLVGCGGVSGKEFFHSSFPAFVQELKLHISALELLSLVVCVKLWGHKWRGLRLQLCCDNSAAVEVVNTGRSRDSFMQTCLRELCFYAAQGEFEIRAIHIPGVDNRVPDLLSRWGLGDRFAREFHEVSKNDELVECYVSDDVFRFNHSW